MEKVTTQPELHEVEESEQITLRLLRGLLDQDSELYRLFYEETGLRPTPLTESSEPVGEHPTFVKKEFTQQLTIEGVTYRAGSFKLRGALLDATLTLQNYPETTRLVTASHGNHALGLAIAGIYLGIPVEIHCPADTHEDKIAKLESYGVIVVKDYATFEEAMAGAEKRAEEDTVHLTHPFDHAAVQAGQGTLLLETYWQLRQLEADGKIDLSTQRVVVGLAVAGGGMYAGCKLALEVLQEAHLPGADNIFLLGAQKENCDAFMRCLEGDTVEKPNKAHFAPGEFDSTCDSTAVIEVGTTTLHMIRKREKSADSFRRVTNSQVARAMVAHQGDMDGYSEPAANLARAGLEVYAQELEYYSSDSHKPVLIDVMCGGPNTTAELSDHYLRFLDADALRPVDHMSNMRRRPHYMHGSNVGATAIRGTLVWSAPFIRSF